MADGTHQVLAKEFGVSRQTVTAIARGIIWHQVQADDELDRSLGVPKRYGPQPRAVVEKRAASMRGQKRSNESRERMRAAQLRLAELRRSGLKVSA